MDQTRSFRRCRLQCPVCPKADTTGRFMSTRPNAIFFFGRSESLPRALADVHMLICGQSGCRILIWINVELALGPVARLAQDEERERTGREARGRGGLGQTEMAMIEAAGAR